MKFVDRPPHVNDLEQKPQINSCFPTDGSQPASSMETLSTDCLDGFGSEPDDVPEEVWGKLLPVGSSFDAFDLVKDEYTFGRGEMCDYQFNSPQMVNHACYQAYSKIHFKLTKEKTSSGIHVFLTDTSSNGTFVNGEKVGKGCKQFLSNNDEIALALKRNKAFVFMDSNATDNGDLPPELTEKYTMSKVLGRGACGEVRLAFLKGQCKKFAIKIIKKNKFSPNQTDQQSNQVMNEVNILKSLSHPCIIAIEDVIDTDEVLYIVMELIEGGELFDRVVSSGRFDEETTKCLFYQMVLGVQVVVKTYLVQWSHTVLSLQYLHEQGISHRDLKPENILLSGESNITLVKVTDFGLSKFVDGNTMLKTFCGTPNYLAPEVLLTAGKGTYTKSIDCWSLGVILFICLVGYPPFSDDRNDMDLPKQITGGHYAHYFKTDEWNTVSDDAKSLVQALLQTDPEKRITLNDALEHSWFKDEAMKKTVDELMHPTTMQPPASPVKKRKLEDCNDSPVKKIAA
ncbi:hypothetical protein CAPTEDRAFT_224883 [Capitella teleta]|uniref:Serine/threonine-protein kinase Chk2 n=1 Tax=Capitella teleta TaxID=283909 RepID=R7TXW0_CAPTE|nr:hypothetical protein CAPTEDRAFT_224883 [Capitella teleta]|eukprot:ELT98753.1 hypothetical protein CAPTEDRAFT_224883 [Capitella teleta]